MASASSQRQSVVPLMVATSPRASTSCRKSANDHRASGTPASIGSSHAMRLISTTTLGGKAVAPLAVNLSRGIQARRDDIVGQPPGCQQNQLRAEDVSIR